MFSLIRQILKKAQSFDAVYERLAKIESQLERLEKLADENESLWQFLDEQKEAEGIWSGNVDEFQDEFSDIIVRNMKPYGDA
jgi:hypothetical protein